MLKNDKENDLLVTTKKMFKLSVWYSIVLDLLGIDKDIMTKCNKGIAEIIMIDFERNGWSSAFQLREEIEVYIQVERARPFRKTITTFLC